MTASNAHAYCDESGDTGANLLDPNQPLFVVGGWLVLDGYIEAAEQRIKEYIGLLAPRDNELHGVDLLKSKIGTIGILNLTKDLMQGCSPICQIAEKRVLLVGHIFNMFLNPRFNPHVPATFEDYFEGKRDLMDKVYSLPDELLEEFFEAYSKLDSSILSASLLHIADELSLRMETDLADLMLGSKPNIEAIVEHNITGRRDFDSVTLNTPNAASFHMFFQSLEQIGRAAEIPKITLVHDDTPQFREA